jgi:hypothetical protein
MKDTDAKFELNDVNPVDMRLLSEQVDLILRSLELYAYNLEYMLNGENCSDNERQKKLAMLKYTYEQVLSEQVNAKANNNETLTPFGKKMIKDAAVIDIIPKNKEFKVV